MNKIPAVVAVACAVLALCVGPAQSARSGQDGGAGGFALYVAPGTIAKSAPCTCVTLHTDVALSAVDGASVQVNGTDVAIDYIKADSRGNIVVKLDFDAVAELVGPPTATITLTLVVDGETLVAAETVAVKD